MKSKIVLITGATGGIGNQTAISLAKLGATVIITGRNKASGEKAISEIRDISGNDNIELILADISTRFGIKELVKQFGTKFNKLDVLINNAGCAASERKLTSDGIELNFATNVMAPYLLIGLMTTFLRNASSPRVITLMGGDLPKKLDLHNLQAEKSFDGLNYYSQSKLTMMAVMYEYAERLKGQNITVNVCYPGQASTNMTQNVTADMLPGIMKLIFPLFKFFVRSDAGKSAKKASRSSVFLATSPEIEGKTGLYFDKNVKQAKWPRVILDASVRKKVWDYTVGLSD
ncbi:MAG: SDR family NAD(P)-dependent oxidoreductase [Bacteroidales bacterium]|nr:SDR family NAD(P)-dependent oxidoreductase [Bacteroidales bacterium]